MAKHKRKRLVAHKVLQPYPTSKPPPKSLPAKPSTQPSPKQPAAPTIPFLPAHTILLIGEGDLSFAASLLAHHGCTSVTATVLEQNIEELSAKYPHVREHLATVEQGGGKVVYGVDVGARGGAGKIGWTGLDRIVFNFPHVGGRSTDVNRQVRYNQELLVSFFKKSLPCLALGGSIIVTLFEGEPYTLWNIRDLARHSGLQVERSFKFQASAYPGYHHARTLGVVKSRTGEVGAGWKGEDRLARSYVFVRKGDEPPSAPSMKKRDDDSSDDDDD